MLSLDWYYLKYCLDYPMYLVFYIVEFILKPKTGLNTQNIKKEIMEKKKKKKIITCYSVVL